MRTQTPIYLHLLDLEAAPHKLLIGDAVDAPPGSYFCHAEAPNGAKGAGQIVVDGDGISRLRVEDLFQDRKPALIELLDDVADLPPDDAEYGFRLIDDSGATVDDSWSLSPIDGPLGLNGVSITHSSPKDTAPGRGQFWSEAGPAIVLALPSEAVLLAVPDTLEAIAPTRPLVVGKDSIASAYWGFARNGSSYACRTIAETAFAAIDSGSDVPLSRLVVAAHGFLQFEKPSLKRMEAFHGALLKHRDTGDFNVLLWCFQLVGLFREFAIDSEESFANAATAIRQGRCTYTFTHRLFLDKMGRGINQVARGKVEEVWGSDEIISNLGWIRDLAAASYWDTECVTFRASRPDRPDPDALGAHIGSEAKKKSAWRPTSH